MKWDKFFAEYRERVIEPKPLEQALDTMKALEHFARIVGPKTTLVKTKDIETFVLKRKEEKGKKGKVSPNTLNKELKHIKTALLCAQRWGHLERMPEIRFVKAPKKLESYIDEEAFSKIYKACKTHPEEPGIEWWQGFLLFQFMTGWRMRQVLLLRWENVDLESGNVFSPAEDNKGKRDVLLPLHPMLIEHLGKLTSKFKVFPFRGDIGKLYVQFGRIQKHAGIVPRNKDGWYTFHDLRRGFATINAEHLDLFELQSLMQHKSLETTRRYVSMARRLRPAVAKINVPDIS